MDNKNNFGYLGKDFQKQLIHNIIDDKTFAQSISQVIKPKYFDNKYFSTIMQLINDYYKKYETTPNYKTLKQLAKSELSSDLAIKMVVDTLNSISKVNNESRDFIQEKSLNFCKQQELQKAMINAQSMIDEGDFENYNKVSEIVNKALEIGKIEKGTSDVFNNLMDVLSDDYREPIPTGINGIDKLLKGGLGKGEIGLILAPTGVGKTSILSKFANNAFNNGYNVLQIFFEDNPKIIQRKHFTMWTGISPDDLSKHRDEVISKVNHIKESSENRLTLKKLPSDTMSMSQIKNEIRRMINDGQHIDMIVLDYIDCVVSENGEGNDYKNEGPIMRSFEAMCGELNVAGWSAVQGGREAISADVVKLHQMGGSIKKAQVGHVIISIAKTLEQKEADLATIAMVKSRIGKDGVVFQNCKFNNKLLEIDVEDSDIMSDVPDNQDDRARDRIRQLMRQSATEDN